MSENRPALSATSDMPPVVPVEPPVLTPEPAPTPVPVPAPTPEPTPAPESRPIEVRFGQLAAQRREAEARAERIERTAAEQAAMLEKALAAINSRLLQQQPPPPPPAAGTISPRPDRASFPDDAAFETALVSWAGEQAAATASAEFQKRQEEAEAARQEKIKTEEETRAREAREAEEARVNREMEAAWELRKAKAVEKYPDFVERTGANSLPISLAMGHVIVTREEGPEIAYYLAQNPKEAARIAGLTVPGQVFPTGHPQAGLPVPNAFEQAFEMGKIAARLGVQASLTSTETAPQPEPPVATPPTIPILPAPPSPISGASAAATRREPSEMSMDEYAALRAPQLFAARTPGRAH